MTKVKDSKIEIIISIIETIVGVAMCILPCFRIFIPSNNPVLYEKIDFHFVDQIDQTGEFKFELTLNLKFKQDVEDLVIYLTFEHKEDSSKILPIEIAMGDFEKGREEIVRRITLDDYKYTLTKMSYIVVGKDSAMPLITENDEYSIFLLIGPILMLVGLIKLIIWFIKKKRYEKLYEKEM